MGTDDCISGDVVLPKSLDDARIVKLPPTAFYISNFISQEEEQIILEKIATAPKPRWKQLSHRRLQTWPSELVKDRLLDAPLPNWLEGLIIERLLSMPISEGSPDHIFTGSPHQRPNHVLINEYPPGVGIMPHNLGASLCLDLYRNKEDGALDPNPAWKILQEPRSLLITTENLYTDYLHGIADIKEDIDLSPEGVANWSLLREPAAFENGRNPRHIRLSLTYRDVLKVSKVGNKLSMLARR